jgi:ATP-binding cassette subfamily B protein IrtA
VLLAANVVLLVPLGIWLNDRGSLSDTDLLFFFVLGLGALAPVVSLLHLFSFLSHLTTGGNLVREVMEAATLDDASGTDRPADASVELRDVSFAYGDQPVLHGVSLRAEPGTLTALVGPSGGGKSTIAALIARFWDVESGAVLVGGADVRRIPPDDLARHVAVVLQDTFLFDDTVAANLRVGRPGATDAEVEEAARAAQAHGFVRALPEGYETVIGERGAQLSGGERQRLALARAILADAPVIVLDEATSFADPDNEVLIQEAITNLVAGRTVVMIAHRLSTIAGADQILVVEAGCITERGAHDQLVAGRGTYRQLWDDFVAAETIALGDAVRTGSEP